MLKMISSNVCEKLGNWLLDIAKYFATAVLTTMVLNYVHVTSMFVIFAVFFAVIAFLVSGLYLIEKGRNNLVSCARGENVPYRTHKTYKKKNNNKNNNKK